MTVTQAPVTFARSFVLPDSVSPAIADLIDHVGKIIALLIGRIVDGAIANRNITVIGPQG